MNNFSKFRYYLGSIWTLFRGVKDPLKLVPVFVRPKSGQKLLLELPSRNLRMWVRGRMDIWSVKEAMLDRFYERFGTQVQLDWTIVDVGAAIGEFTTLAAKQAFQGKVFAIEPNPASIELLQQNLDINGVTNVKVFQKGLWCNTSLQTLNIVNDEPLQAMTLATDEKDTRQIQFETQTLASFINEHQLKQIDLLKSDAEGAEYEILLTCPSDVLQLVKRIVMEYHDLDNSHNHNALAKFLSSKGYKILVTPNQVHADIGYLYAEHRSTE